MAKEIPPLALTFDDVSLVPAFSEIHPQETAVDTIFTRNIKLNIPLVSAAMDTVTESTMAIAIARQGGIGVIHKNLSIDSQAEEVDMVKRSEAGMITNPITIAPDRKVGEALDMMKKFRISGVPVVDPKGKLLGILTNRDLRFEDRTDLLVSELMTKENLKTVPVGTTLEEAKKLLQKYKIEKLLVVDRTFHLKGLITVKDIQKKIKYPNACKDDMGRLRVAAAVGVSGDLLERARALVGVHVDAMVLDSSHGHSKGVLEAARLLKEKFPEVDLVVGNVATEEGAKALIGAGCDAVKVGIGPGSICTTRVITGAGVPQLTAIMETARAAKAGKVPIIADGGIRYSGEIVKALAAGANSVMIGSLFAGTEEAPGETILYQGRTFKVYRGMGSLGAMKAGSADRYFQEGALPLSKLVPEGIEGMVPFKGSLENMVFQLVGGVRSGMGLVGAKNLKDLRENASFVRVTVAGLKESHPHDVTITKEAPNYMKEDD
ncbi:MAG TPA: IMP dehydrogenase [Acidobacteriota bacterium]|mgnify:FL=1|nr:IMP dehydrogenase [Acidobacteriota bacterium]HNT16872.1 IMP dehydrogenase [Acidobacteriota bacterium]HPA26143.1 IMP dehydrogenase [Acidobacteriota bacterium]HQO19607.1 IMP dehydrogenase [Acidobacteriota bacterium]HQQ46218.1 IMP dehydrogenase [Acidobacteriota bacterium]